MSKNTGYWASVEAIAEEAIELYPDNEDSQHQHVHESVEYSHYIIHYSEQDEVLSCTDNYPDERDVAEMCSRPGDWQEVKTLTAYLAMEQDVLQTLYTLRKKREKRMEFSEDLAERTNLPADTPIGIMIDALEEQGEDVTQLREEAKSLQRLRARREP